MPPIRYVKPDFSEDLFVGTAAHYAKSRLPYPAALNDDLLERAGISGEGRLLDLACGPGRVCIPLSSSFKDVWALDLEPQMIEVGRAEARKQDVTNIKWFVGKAEEFVAKPRSFELITIGEAFHRLDQALIARRAFEWLDLGGCLAIMGCSSMVRGKEPWQRIVAEIANEWEGRIASGDASTVSEKPGSGPEHNRLVLQDVGFDDIGSYEFPHTRRRTVDSIIGWLFSTSRFSERRWGDNAKAFEAEIRRALLNHDDRGAYVEHVQCGFTIGRRLA